MKWAAILIIAIQFIGLGYSIARHGKPKEGIENGWSTLIATVIMLALLYFAGTFDCLIK